MIIVCGTEMKDNRKSLGGEGWHFENQRINWDQSVLTDQFPFKQTCARKYCLNVLTVASDKQYVSPYN